MKITQDSAEHKPLTDPPPPPPNGSYPLLDTLETSVHSDTTPASERDRGKGGFVAFEARKRKARAFGRRLYRMGFEGYAHKIGQCCAQLNRLDFHCGHSVKSSYRNGEMLFRCKDRFCPVCSHKRSADYALRFAPALKVYGDRHGLYAYHLVLTFVNSETLGDLSAMKRCVKNLFRSKRFKAVGYHGSLVSFETKVGRDGLWHNHFHVLLFTEQPLPLIETGKHKGEWQNSFNQEVSDLWRKITGGSYIVKGKAFEWDDMPELVKYVTKDTDELRDERLMDLIEWSKGRRFISLNGKLYNNPELKSLFDDIEAGRDERVERCPYCDAEGSDRYDIVELRWSHKHERYVVEQICTQHGEVVEMSFSPP